MSFPQFLVFALIMPAIILYFELLLRFSTSKDFFNIGLIFVFTFSIATGLFISFFIAFFKKLPRYIITLVFTSIFTIYYATQLVYYKVFSNFMIMFSLFNGTNAVGENTITIMNTITQNLVYILLMFVPLIVLIVLRKQYRKILKVTIPYKIICIVIGIFLQLASIVAIKLDNKSAQSSDFLYFESFQMNANVDRFGMITAARLDIEQLFKTSSKNQEPAKPIEDNNTTPPTITQTNENIGKPQTLNLDFDSLIESSKNETTKELHQYFKDLPPTTKNEHTAKIAGYNIIYITAESFSDYAVDKNLTPTLYKMATEGYNFTNFYNPEWGVSTSDGEYQNCIGLIPKAGVWSFFKQGTNKNALPFTLGNEYRFQGITPLAYHNNTYDYYDRDISHPNAGYLYKGLGNGLDVKKTWPESDLEMMKNSIDDYINDPLFSVYYMTVSGHMDYTWGGNYIASQYKDKVSNLNLSDQAKAYKACNIDFDLAMEYLLQRLYEKGIADKTLIVIGADHYPYGLDNEVQLELAGKDSFAPDFERYKSRLIIWSGNLKGDNGKKVDKLVSSMDILPTTLNLLGLPYDSRMLAGRDIFSDTPGIVMFQDYSWKTEQGYFFPKSNKFTKTTTATVDEKYVDDTNNLVKKTFWTGSKILENDYFRNILTKSQMDIINNPIPCPSRIAKK
ncbi:MAG: sulfatase-like hydrolase/transferase [Clostridia bacterium]